jgi:hypothetical protein
VGEPVKRKLAAVLAADAVSYSHLMAEDEEGTLRILAALYLENYPNGMFSALARARLDALAQAEAKRAKEAQGISEASSKRASVGRGASAPAAVSTATTADARAVVAAPSPAEHQPRATQQVATAPSVPEPGAHTSEAPAAGGGNTLHAHFDGRWLSQLDWEAFQQFPAYSVQRWVTIHDNQLAMEWGKPGLPGYRFVQGKVAEDGSLALTGKLISRNPRNYGNEAPARFQGRFESERYEGVGNFGRRACTVKLTRPG